MLLYGEPPAEAPAPYLDTKALQIERSRMTVLGYRMAAQSRCVLSRFPYTNTGILNWLRRRDSMFRCVAAGSQTAAPRRA